MLEDATVRAALARRSLPIGFERRVLRLGPGEAHTCHESEWHDALVLVEHGTLDVRCRGGGRREFGAGSLLALDWLPLRALANAGTDDLVLLAVRRPHAVGAAGGGGHSAQGAQNVRFRTVIELGGKTATGFQVPLDVLEQLGKGKRPPVVVRIGSHTYRSTVAPMDGAYYVPLSAENREAAGVAASDEVDVELELDEAPRTVDVPPDFAAALDAEPAARTFFDGLSVSNRKWHVLSVTGAKTDETRQRRIARSVEMLREGRAR
jgi:hypothetical protein